MSLERLAPIYGRIKDDIIMGGIIRYQQIRHRMMIDFEQHTGHRFAITEDTNIHLIQLSEREWNNLSFFRRKASYMNP
ncbi:hypothetical protein [Mycoplasmopsis arginini]|nr:hypothetical protein [Mycoplasmopsis arginini]